MAFTQQISHDSSSVRARTITASAKPHIAARLKPLAGSAKDHFALASQRQLHPRCRRIRATLRTECTNLVPNKSFAAQGHVRRERAQVLPIYAMRP